MHNPASPPALNFKGLYARELEVLNKLAAKRQLTAAEAVRRVELLSHTGNIDGAIQAAEDILGRRESTDSLVCRLLDALGTSYFRKGDQGAAHRQYDRALTIAKRIQDPTVECRLRLHLFRHEIHWTGLQRAASDVSQLRRLVHHIADPHLSLKFQLGLVELAARLGLIPRARRHLEAARALAEVVDDRALQAEFLLYEMTLNGFESNLPEAIRLGLELAPIASEIGSSSIHFGVYTNVAHLLIAQARFDEALGWLRADLTNDTAQGASRIASRGTLMLLHLSRGALEEAGEEAQRVDQLVAAHKGESTFFGMWYQLTRIRWQYRTGAIEEGLKAALSAVPRAERLADRSLVQRLQLLAVEGFAKANRIQEAQDLLARAVDTSRELDPEMIAEVARVTGLILVSEKLHIAQDSFYQASSILRAIGNLAAAVEIEREARELKTAQRDEKGLATPAPRLPTAGSEIAITNRLAHLANLGGYPLVMAAELMAVLVSLEVIERAAIVEICLAGKLRLLRGFPSGQSFEHLQSHKQGVVEISLGNRNNCTLQLWAVPKPTAAAHVAVSSIKGMAAAARLVAKAKHDQREEDALWPEQPAAEELGLTYVSERMRDLVNTVRRAAGAPISVLFTGESGVGKELFARALHIASARKDKTFLPFNCATVPKDMLDSQLFGHRKGAFTGAHEAGLGVIRAADGGTLFLDEIGEMSMDAQPKLLRFLESGEIHPLGEPKPVQVDVRIVAATNASLEALVSEGRFREDLFYRLNVLPLHIPPLRERREEVPALVDHFVDKFGREMQKPMLRVADETLEYLLLYRWPGNIRQLANEIRRMVALAEPGATLTPAHLSKEIIASRRTVAVEPSEFVMRLDQPLADATAQLERAAIERAFAASDGNLDQAATILGLSRKGLYLKRQRLGLK
jgi:transcriptional regulator with PAS, ATPase and Fis domain/tetratricopeptide (TPR) repeat protein